MRKVSKEKIVEYAKELYLTPNKAGSHKYSLQNVCNEILRKFNKSLTKPTILNWAHKYGWDKLWEQAVKEGITEALGNGQTEEDKTKEEQFKEAIAKRKRDDFLISTSLKKLGYQFIKEHGFNSVKEALDAINTGMKYTQDLTEEKEEGNVIKIVVASDKGKELTEKIIRGDK